MPDEIKIYNEIKRTLEGKIYFAFHVFIYVIVNIVLFIINRCVTPQFHWWMWISICWGLALYFHFIAVFIFNPLNKKRWRKYLRRKGKEKSFIDFFYHLHIYIGVNIFLIVINRLTSDISWSIYPLLFWGLGLVIHFSLIKYLPRKKLLELGARMKTNELLEAKIYLLIHLIVFLFFNLLIFILNFIIMRGEWWFIYPLIGWGLGVFFHGVWIFLNKSHRIKRFKQNQGIKLLRYYE